MPPTLHHVAVLVRSAKTAAAQCADAGYEVGPTEDFPSEGTREVYVGPPTDPARLLLMEATGPGPYRTALDKRGPGLHHVAVHVASLETYVASLAGSGWLLHPRSLHTYDHRKAVYLARPGLHTLIEVQQDDAVEHGGNRFISEIAIVGDVSHERLLSALGVSGLRLAAPNDGSLVIAGRRIPISDLA